MIDLDANQIKLAATLMGHMPEKIPHMLANVANRVVAGIRTDASRQAREAYTVKLEGAWSKIRVSKASASNLLATVRVKGSPIPLSKFNIRPNSAPSVGRQKKPIFAQVLKARGGTLKKAFLARGENGIGVYRRLSAARNPIGQHYGPSVPQMMGHTDVSGKIERLAKERLDKRFEHELNRYLRGINI